LQGVVVRLDVDVGCRRYYHARQLNGRFGGGRSADHDRPDVFATQDLEASGAGGGGRLAALYFCPGRFCFLVCPAAVLGGVVGLAGQVLGHAPQMAQLLLDAGQLSQGRLSIGAQLRAELVNAGLKAPHMAVQVVTLGLPARQLLIGPGYALGERGLVGAPLGQGPDGADEVAGVLLVRVDKAVGVLQAVRVGGQAA